jgi:hypothetical protein
VFNVRTAPHDKMPSTFHDLYRVCFLGAGLKPAIGVILMIDWFHFNRS